MSKKNSGFRFTIESDRSGFSEVVREGNNYFERNWLEHRLISNLPISRKRALEIIREAGELRHRQIQEAVKEFDL